MIHVYHNKRGYQFNTYFKIQLWTYFLFKERHWLQRYTGKRYCIAVWAMWLWRNSCIDSDSCRLPRQFGNQMCYSNV